MLNFTIIIDKAGKYIWIGLFLLLSCQTKKQHEKEVLKTEENLFNKLPKALLASRFEGLNGFKKVVKVRYYNNGQYSDEANPNNKSVHLSYQDANGSIVSSLEGGMSQGDIKKAKEGDWEFRFHLIFGNVGIIKHRIDLARIYTLARRRNDLMGWRDFAFYDITESTISKISTKELAYLTPRDSSEKGFINTFNHITAQAIITSCFSESVAEFVADTHERDNMPELIHGVFSKEQLTDLNTNPVDNYVDMINNEIGQELGKRLKEKYDIRYNTYWTPELLTNYLNDLQQYYSWSFDMGVVPFNSIEEGMIRFTEKINYALTHVSFERQS